MKFCLSVFVFAVALVSVPAEARKKRLDDQDGPRGLRKKCELPKFSEVYVFGDGLSDIGNLHSIDGAAAPTGRATDGKVAVEYLSQRLGVCQATSMHLLTDHAPGCNYAVRGANSIPVEAASLSSTVDVPEHRLPAQIGAFLGRHMKHHIPRDALYVLMAGYEDVVDVATAVDRGEIIVAEAKRRLDQAATSMADGVRSLIESGAKYVMVVGPPSAGDAPRFSKIGKMTKNRSRRANRLTEDLHEYLESAIEEVECATGVDVVNVDVYDAADDSRYAFWDDVFPDRNGHEVLGETMLKSLKESICGRFGFPKKNTNKCGRNKRTQRNFGSGQSKERRTSGSHQSSQSRKRSQTSMKKRISDSRSSSKSKRKGFHQSERSRSGQRKKKNRRGGTDKSKSDGKKNKLRNHKKTMKSRSGWSKKSRRILNRNPMPSQSGLETDYKEQREERSL